MYQKTARRTERQKLEDVMKLKRNPCENCKKVADAMLTMYQVVNENCYAIRFKCTLCGAERFRLLTKAQLDKEVEK